jgi:hypothetical protein
MANEVTFTPEALQQVIAQAVAEALRARDAKPMPKNTLVDGKTEQQLRIDIMVVKAFKKAGYGEVKPREDVMTYKSGSPLAIRSERGNGDQGKAIQIVS